MKKPLSPWCKAAQKELIERDMTTAQLADAIGRSREYTSAIINGRVFSESTMKLISDELNIPDDGYDVPG